MNHRQCNQFADGRMDPTALFSTGQCGLCAYVSEKKWAHFIVYFIESGIIGSGNEECDESLESGVRYSDFVRSWQLQMRHTRF